MKLENRQVNELLIEHKLTQPNADFTVLLINL